MAAPSWPALSWPVVRAELLTLWHYARARPVRAAAAALAVTIVAAAIGATLITLATDPLRTLSALFSTLAFLTLVGGAVWGVSWLCAIVAGALVRTFGFFLPGTLTARVAIWLRSLGALVGAAVAWLVIVWVSPTSWLTVVLALVLAVGLSLATRDRRRHAARLRWLTGHLLGAAREFDPESGQWQITDDEWSGDHLVRATAHYPADVRVSEPTVRRGIERAAMWAMRHDPHVYTLRWSATARTVDVVAEPPLPDRFIDAKWPRFPAGIPLAVVTASRADVVVRDEHGERIGLRCWDPTQERDFLICGVKGSGKTVLCRRLVVHGLNGGWFPGGAYLLDGKSGDDYIPLEGRKGVEAVAVLPAQWAATLGYLVDLVNDRYAQKRAAARGQQPKPKLDRVLVLVDEIQNIIAKVPDAEEQIEELARMARAAGVSLVFATQRPDTKNVLPGAVRDQLEDRAACGWMSEQGARMVLAEAWRLVVDEDDATGEVATIAKPRGRAVLRIAGRLDRVQIPWMDSPLEDPEWEPLYPPRESEPAPEPPAGATYTPTPPEQREAAHEPPKPAAAPVRDDKFFE